MKYIPYEEAYQGVSQKGTQVEPAYVPYDEAYKGPQKAMEDEYRNLLWESAVRTGLEAAGKIGGSVGAIADMVWNLIPLGVGLGANYMMTARASASGESSKTAYTAGRLAQEIVTAPISSPFEKLFNALGIAASYKEAPPTQVIESLYGKIEEAGKWVEKKTNAQIPSDAVLSLVDTIMYSAGARGMQAAPKVREALQKYRQERAEQPKPPPEPPIDEVIRQEAKARRAREEEALARAEAAQEYYRKLFGIKTHAERAAIRKQRAKEIREAFEKEARPVILDDGRVAYQGPAAADYFRFKAEEAVQRLHERLQEDPLNAANAAQEYYNQLLGIKRAQQAAAARSERLRDIRAAFEEEAPPTRLPSGRIAGQGPAYADYLRFKAEEAIQQRQGPPDPIELANAAQEYYRKLFGIKTAEELAKEHKARAQALQEAFQKGAPLARLEDGRVAGHGPEYADYLAFKANESLANHRAWTASVRAKEILETKNVPEVPVQSFADLVRRADIDRIAAARKPSLDDVIQILEKPDYKITGDDLITLRAWNRQRGSVDPDFLVGAAAGGVLGMFLLDAYLHGENPIDTVKRRVDQLIQMLKRPEPGLFDEPKKIPELEGTDQKDPDQPKGGYFRPFKIPPAPVERPTLHTVEAGLPFKLPPEPVERGTLPAVGAGLAAPLVLGAIRGSATPRLLAGISAIGLGGLIGSQLASEHPGRGLLLGALAGAYLGLPGAKARLEAALDKGAYIARTVSGQFRDMSPRIWLKTVELDKNILLQSYGNLQPTLGFLSALQHLPKAVRDEIAVALANNTKRAEALIKEQGPAFYNAWKKTSETLTRLGEEAKRLGFVVDLREGYFPRLVEDYKGLMKALGKGEGELGSRIEQLLAEAEKDAIRKRGYGLNDWEKSKIINNEIMAVKRAPIGKQPSFFKDRTIDEITKDLLPYYATPAEALYTYVRTVVDRIETARFFGKDLVLRDAPSGVGKIIDTDLSIGNLIRSELPRLSPEKQDRLISLLKSRFEGGNKHPSRFFQEARAIAHLGLIGNYISALTQLGDLPIAVLHNGSIRPVVAALAAKARGTERLRAQHFGLADHIAEELVHASRPGRAWYDPILWANKTLRYTIGVIDRPIKDIALNAHLAKYERLAQTPAGVAKIQKQWGEAFGTEFPALLEDLRAGRVTDRTTTLAFAELSRTQPISKIDHPQAYLDHPNARILYTLKTFFVKQLNYTYEIAKDALKSKDPAEMARAAAKLTALGLLLGFWGVLVDDIKRILRGLPPKGMDWVTIADNALKTYGLGEWVRDKLASGKARDLGSAVGSFVLPPWEIFAKIATADPEIVRHLPFVGQIIYDRYMGGAEKAEIREALKQKKETGTMPSLSPKAQQYLEEKRRELQEKRRQKMLYGE
jgi:hypothetical protein